MEVRTNHRRPFPVDLTLGMTGQSISLDGGGSWTGDDGWIDGYYWDFGDDTWGSGPNPSHQYNANGAYTVTLYVSESNGNWGSSQSFVTVDSVSLPARINFDELPNNTVVADQYLSQYGVRFYSGNSFYPVHTYQNCGPCSTTSPPNYIVTKPDDAGQTTVEFTQPVSNLTFYMIGVDAFFNQFSILDVYRNSALYATYPVYGNGTRTVGVNLGSLTDISKVVIRGINDPLGIGFDDFTFTIPSDIKITSARVGGYLNGTTQNALLAADVALNATPVPSGFAGGTYAWTFTGSPTITTGINQSSVAVRWNQTGTYRATVTYTKNGASTSGFVDVTVVLPLLTSFSAVSVASDQANRNSGCSFLNGSTYTLGCWAGTADDGIIWNSTTQIPSGPYLSDLAQSGIKFVQVINTFRKRLLGDSIVINGVPITGGNTQCFTHRSPQSNFDSGWQLDSNLVNQPGHPVRYFSEGTTLTMGNFDPPGESIEFGSNFYDAFFVSEYFETYVFYFIGDPLHPTFQRAMALSGSGNPYARLAWNWGGQVSFNYYISPSLYRRDFTSTPGLPINATGTNSIQSTSTNVHDINYQTCEGTTVTNNSIDGSRYFVTKLYSDFLRRDPDQGGLNYWRYNITQCAFDMNCVGTKRVDVARAFFYSGDFIQLHPALGGQRGTHAYNEAFVYACYNGFLRREPNAPPDNNWDGFNYWVGVLDSTNPDAGDGKYNNIINAFLLSTEYRDRF